jgi:putative membrane protein
LTSKRRRDVRRGLRRDGSGKLWAVGALYVFTAIGCLAYALAVPPSAERWLPHRAELLEYGPIVFSRTQIVLSFCVLTLLLGRWRTWIEGFAAVVLLGFLAEFIGVRTGLLFGRYHFSEMLGPKILGTVPLVMPFAWFNVAVPAHAIAARALPDRAFRRWLLGAGLMLAWDLSIDPVMGHLYPYWVWESPGAYYGIPLSNFIGWYAVGLLAMALLDRSWRSDDASPLVFAHYGATLAMPMGLACLAGMWPAAALSATVAGVGLLVHTEG